jgi:hypothetical protein
VSKKVATTCMSTSASVGIIWRGQALRPLPQPHQDSYDGAARPQRSNASEGHTLHVYLAPSESAPEAASRLCVKAVMARLTSGCDRLLFPA